MNERYLIALGGLLHDIGKFVQRAIKEDENLKQEFPSEWAQKEKNLEKEYKYKHAYISAVFIEKYRDKIKDAFGEDLAEKLISWGAKHHSPDEDLGSVISQIADWYSSAEREEMLKSEFSYLHSVFERISLTPKEYRKDIKEYAPSALHDLDESFKRYFGIYNLHPLHVDKGAIFPQGFLGGIIKEEVNTEKGIKEFYTIKSYESVKVDGKYSTLFIEFKEEFEKIMSLKNNTHAVFNAIFYLLYKYTWCVPASTFDIENGSRHYPDISLFDHSRVLSAIAVSLYDWAMANNKDAKDIKPSGRELPTDKEEVFLLVEGDIGGIQNFIYNIHKSSESELSIAKALRGRSFFLTMLPEVIARYILKELDYPITNALYIGGGKFQLLIANTNRNIEDLKRIEREVNKWMHKEFQGELSLSIAYVPMKGSALREREVKSKDENGEPKTYLDHIEWLQLELDRKKKRKFEELLLEEFEKDAIEADEICPSCRTLYKEEDEDFCTWCQKSQEWGEVLPKIKFIAFDWGKYKTNNQLNRRKIMLFGDFGNVYLLEEEDLDKVKELPEILNIEDTELSLEEDKIVNGFKFIGHSAPQVKNDKNLIECLNKLWEEKQKNKKENEKQKLEAYHILPFELLVEFAEGDKKLGFFRADVDFLGLILSDGLRFNEFGNEEIYTISRVATLSRMLDLFFAGYLNKLCEEVSREYVKKALEEYKDKELTPVEEKRKKLLEKIYNNGNLKVGSLIYTVYSGGDDLFVIAPYDLAVEFALRLRKEFREFTCNNPDFGISGGIFIGRHNTPIHLVAKFAEDLENKAKKEREVKDMIAIFGKALTWDSEIEKTLNMKGLSDCSLGKEDLCKDKKTSPCFINLDLVNNVMVSPMSRWLKEGKVSRGLYYKLLQLYKNYVKRDTIDPAIYPKIYYYIGRNVKDEHVKNWLINALLNGMDGKTDVRAVITNLDVILSLVLMKTRRGGE